MSKKLVKISKNESLFSTFFADPCADCSKRIIRISYLVNRISPEEFAGH